MEDQALAGAQKKATREGRIIIFIDESGISERPHRVSTWAPKGQTPVLQYSFTWKQLSAVAGISFWNIYFKLVQGAVRQPQVEHRGSLDQPLLHGGRLATAVFEQLLGNLLHQLRLTEATIDGAKGDTLRVRANGFRKTVGSHDLRRGSFSGFSAHGVGLLMAILSAMRDEDQRQIPPAGGGIMYIQDAA